jgi:vancomycin resistance protein YoaR
VEAKLVRRGLSIELVPGRPGLQLDQKAAESRIVRALARLERGGSVALPVLIDPVEVGAADLAPAARQARLALSAPVRLEYEGTRWRIPRWRIAELLSLPAEGKTELAIAGPGAEAWFTRLRESVERAPVDARFEVDAGGEIQILPDKPGLGIDVPATAEAILTAATTPTARTATLAARTTVADRTVAEAQTMGITGVVGSYHTTYGGIPSRLHNVALVAELIDGALIAPGRTFSFNGTTGERTAEKGFQEAPVIINGELQTGLGGGICQVSTTVFNAAYEAGLQIDERTNHALYISHYPLGRDATVNYPDLDLKFTNDTDNWLLLRTFVGSGSLTVNLYGTPQDRRVESSEQPLRVIGAPKVKRVPEPTWLKGKSEVLEYGQPARATSVSRMVYAADGTLLHEDTWYSQYRSEPKVLRVGTKPKPKPKTKQPKVDPLVPSDVADAPPASTPRP